MLAPPVFTFSSSWLPESGGPRTWAEGPTDASAAQHGPPRTFPSLPASCKNAAAIAQLDSPANLLVGQKVIYKEELFLV